MLVSLIIFVALIAGYGFISLGDPIQGFMVFLNKIMADPFYFIVIFLGGIVFGYFGMREV